MKTYLVAVVISDCVGTAYVTKSLEKALSLFDELCKQNDFPVHRASTSANTRVTDGTASVQIKTVEEVE
jgi:hypothetical protein